MSHTILVPPIPFPLTISQLVQALQDAQTTRYLSVAGLIILLYDHLLTLSDEINLVWSAPRSFAKYAYLVNRYLVLACLLTMAHEMCGFAGDIYSNAVCRRLLFVISILSLFSIAIGNILVLLRVVLLWDHRPIIVRLMTGGFIASSTAQATLMIATLVDVSPGLYWVSAPLGMCVTIYSSPKLIGVWASPMLFEVLVLFSTILNAFDRPHQAELRVAKTLYRDGIMYFCAVTFFRTLNLIFSIVGRPSTTMLMVFFAWSCTTTVLSRALLHIRQQEIMADKFTAGGRTSPFNSSIMRTELAIIDHENSWLHLATIRSPSR